MTSTFQPCPPQPDDLGAIPLQLPHVPRDAVVGIVTYQLLRQPGALVEQRPVTVAATPVADCDQRTGKPALGRRLPHHVLALLRFHPGAGEAEKVERWSLAVWMRSTATLAAPTNRRDAFSL